MASFNVGVLLYIQACEIRSMCILHACCMYMCFACMLHVHVHVFCMHVASTCVLHACCMYMCFACMLHVHVHFT